MKIFKIICLFIVFSVFSISCESSDSPNNEIIDDYKLLTVSNSGGIFKIGINTGNLEKIGQIKSETATSILPISTVTFTEEKIYSIEFLYNPAPTNNLLIYDRQTKTTEIVPLVIPANFVGVDKAIRAAVLDGNTLIAIMAENVLMENGVKHIIRIDLQNYSITDLGITFTEDKLSSMVKMDSKLFISTYGEGFLELDLNTKVVNKLQFNNADLSGGRIAVINNSELAFMQNIPVNVNVGGKKLVKLNLTNKTIYDMPNNEIFGVTGAWNTIYKDNQYINLIHKSGMYLGILKTNFDTNQNTIVKVKTTSINPNLTIIGTIDN